MNSISSVGKASPNPSVEAIDKVAGLHLLNAAWMNGLVKVIAIIMIRGNMI